MSDPLDSRRVENSRSPSPQAGPSACQPLPMWAAVCAGTMPEDAAMSHLRHAIECRDCAWLLQQANAAFAAEAASEEQAVLDQLDTTSPAGQLHLARLLAGETARERSRTALRRSRGFLIPVICGAAAACLILAAIFILRQPSDATVIAEAWNEQRPSELRFPGTEPGPVASPTRGSNNRIESSQLLRLTARTQDEIDKQPDRRPTPAQHQILGRIALAEGRGDFAFSQFDAANSLDPNLPGITFDLASAWFERAESSGDLHDYAYAIELYKRHLQKVNGKDPVALYNLALCWERQAVSEQAIVYFEAALAVEKDPRWRQEIESHLSKLRRTSSQYSSPRQPPSAAAFLSSHEDLPGTFEQVLSLASRAWLPRRATDPQIDAALQKLGKLGVSHHDHWIEDMLAAQPSKSERVADEALSRALTASASGDTDSDLTESARAMKLYWQLNNQPGYLRSAVEHVYALQRMGRDHDCLQEAAALSQNPQLVRYAWTRIYLQLATGTAYGMLGDPHRDRRLSAAAAQSAAQDGLPLSSLRATSFVVNDDLWIGHYEPAWREATGALSSSETVLGADMARFQLLSALITIAQNLNLSWTRVGLAEAAAAAATSTPNRKVAAYSMEELGLDDLQVGDLSGAQRSFESADILLASLGKGPAAQRFGADWTSDRALLVARTRGPAAGAAMLASQELTVRQSEALESRLRFYTEYADLLRQSRNTQASLHEILYAIADAERSLSNVRTFSDRAVWPQQTRKAYEVLVADLAESNPTMAVRAWEWFQSAPFREGLQSSAVLSTERASAQLDAVLPSLPPEPSGHVTLVVARILDHYVLWSLNDDPQHPVRQYILNATPASILERAATFLRLCSDPRSAPAEIRLLGDSLYANLLAPVDDQLSPAHDLSLDIDNSLAALPFAALRRHGNYLGIVDTLTVLSNSWVLHSRGSAPSRLPVQPLLAVLQEQPSAAQPSIPPEYNESGDIQRLFPGTKVERATLTRDGTELAFAGSPALRSVLSHADAIHYVGHGLDDTPGATVQNSLDLVLKLSPGLLSHTRLAVLAACQTLREREDTAVDDPSFARIMMAAGADNVLATQWDVDSRTTSRLMQQFYASLAAGTTFSEALRQAQERLQTDPASAHPYFWSGFQLVGSP